MDVGVDVDITSQSIKCFAQHTCVEGTALPSALSQGVGAHSFKFFESLKLHPYSITKAVT